MRGVCVSRQVVSSFATPWTVAHRLLCPWDFPGKNTGVDGHFLLQGIFQTQGSNRGLLRWRWLLYLTEPPGNYNVQSVQSLSRLHLFRTPWTAAHQASLSINNSWSLLKFMSIELVMPSGHLILCGPPLLLPSIFPSIRFFSNESVLHIRWPKYWSFRINISPSNKHSGLISLGWTGWISLQFRGLSRVFSNSTVQKHQIFIRYWFVNIFQLCGLFFHSLNSEI